MHSEVQAFLALLSVEGAGYTTVNNIAEAAAAAGQRIGNLVGLPAAEVVERLGLQRGDAAYFVSRCTARDMGRAQELLEQAEAGGARAISRGHEDYPESLVSCLGSAAPPLLFCLGDSNPLREAGAAVVGARRASTEGLSLAEDCARCFSEHGIHVVSGGAQGVDAAAHSSALAHGGRTIVVSATGILEPLRGDDFRGDGLTLVSEFSPDAPWAVHRAIARNATVCALSRLVCVIEPERTGGSIRTARSALQQGKRVLVACREGLEDLQRQLVRGGAHELRGDEGFSEAELLGHWAASEGGGMKQGELSEG